jgi:protein TonB
LQSSAPQSSAPPATFWRSSTLVALATDGQLIDALQDIPAAIAELAVVASPAQFIEAVSAHDGCVGLIDAAALEYPGASILALRQHFPAMVLIIAGSGHVLATLAPILTDSTAYRFLHKPASVQRLRLFVEAAAHRRTELMELERTQSMRRLPDPEPRLLGSRRTRILAAACAVGVVVTLSVWGLAARRGQQPTPGLGRTVDATQTVTARPAPPSDPAVDQLLKAADAAIAQNRLAAEDGTGAGELYAAALRRAPHDARAAQGLDRVVTALLDGAESAAGATPDEAAARVDEALRLQPDNSRATALRVSLLQQREADLRAQLRKASSGAKGEQLQLLLQVARKRISSGALTQPADDSAAAYLAAARKLVPDDDTVKALSRELSQRLAHPRPQPAAAPALQAAQPPIAVPAAPQPGPLDTSPQINDPAGAGVMLPFTELKRDRFVAPNYPPRALAAGITGWVDVDFVVATDGSVRDVAVTAAEPRGIFDAAAVAAVTKWHFQSLAGIDAERHTHVRVRFALDPAVNHSR